MNKSCVYNWVQATSHTAGTTCCKSLLSVLLRTCRFLSFCCVCEVHLCLCVLTTAVASLQSEGSTSCSCVPSLCILRLCFLTVLCCCVRWIKDFFILQVCNSVTRGLKEKGSKFVELFVICCTIKTPTWVAMLYWILYKHGTKDCPHLRPYASIKR